MQPRHEQAGPRRHDLRTRCCTAHVSAEQPVAGCDAGDVRAVLARHDAEVDVLVLAVGLHDERHAILHSRRRVVGAEVPDVEVDRVVLHRGLVGERTVCVSVPPNLTGRVVPEHCEHVGVVTVTVQVSTGSCNRCVLAPEVRVRLTEGADAVRARGGRRIGVAVPGERGSGDLSRHVDPRRVVVVHRIGAGDPVDDLPLARARGEQARMIERDSSVDDADRHAAAVPRGMRVHELRGPGVLGRHVGVHARSRR